MMTLTLASRALQGKVKSAVAFAVPWKAVFFVALLALVCMLVSYIFLVNELTRGAYLIKKYNAQIGELSRENSMLEVGFAESGFLGKATKRAKALNFERTKAITYIQILA